MKPPRKQYKELHIPSYKEGELYRKSCENVRLEQLKRKADIEAEWRYNKKYIGSPMPDQANYLKEIVKNYLKWKNYKLTLW